MSVGDILMVSGGLLLGSCCCLCIVCVAYVRSQKQLLARSESTMAVIHKKNVDGEAYTVAHILKVAEAEAQVPHVQGVAAPLAHETTLGTDSEEMDGENDPLPCLPDSLPAGVPAPKKDHYQTDDRRNGDMEGGQHYDHHFEHQLSPCGPRHFGHHRSDGSSMYDHIDPSQDQDVSIVMFSSTQGGSSRGRPSIDAHSKGPQSKDSKESSKHTTSGQVARFLGLRHFGGEPRPKKESVDDIDNAFDVADDQLLNVSQEVMVHDSYGTMIEHDVEVLSDLERNSAETPDGMKATQGFIGGMMSHERLQDIESSVELDVDEDVVQQIHEHDDGADSEQDLMTIGHYCE